MYKGQKKRRSTVKINEDKMFKDLKKQDEKVRMTKLLLGKLDITTIEVFMVHKITITGNPAYLAGRLKLRDEDERELRGWGGRTVEIPDYSLETSRAGRLYNSERRDVNLQVQRRSKEVGERADTSETKEVTTKERKTRGKSLPSR